MTGSAAHVTKLASTKKRNPVDVEAMILESGTSSLAFRAHELVLEAGALIRKLRLKKGYSQEVLAKLAGTSQPHLSKLEKGRGRQGPTVELLARIAETCDEPVLIVPLSELGKLRERVLKLEAFDYGGEAEAAAEAEPEMATSTD